MAKAVSTNEFLEAVKQYQKLFVTISVNDGDNVKTTGFAQAHPATCIDLMDRTILDPKSKQKFSLDHHTIQQTLNECDGERVEFDLRSATTPMKWSVMFLK